MRKQSVCPVSPNVSADFHWPEPGEYGVVPKYSVVADPFNPRKHFDPLELEALAEGIRLGGQREVLTVRTLWPEEKGALSPEVRYRVVSGGRRQRGVDMAGLETLRIFVKAYENESDKSLDAFLLNEDRVGLSDIERADEVRRLKALHDWATIEETAVHVRVDAMTVSKYLVLERLIPEVRARMMPDMKKNQMKLDVGVFFTKLDPDLQRELIANLPPAARTIGQQLDWLRAQTQAKGVVLPTRRKRGHKVRELVNNLAKLVERKTLEFGNLPELPRMFDTVPPSTKRDTLAALRQAYAALGAFIRRIEADSGGSMSHGQMSMIPTDAIAVRKSPSVVVPAPQARAEVARPVARLRPTPKVAPAPSVSRRGEDLTVQYWDPDLTRIVLDKVSMEKYRDLWSKGFLRFQREGTKRPDYYPDLSLKVT